MKKLSTIIGLGFTIILVDGDLLTIYAPYLQTFLRYRDFKAHSGFINILSHAIAEIIDGAVHLSRPIKHSQYYGEFSAAVKNAVTPIMLHEAGKAEEAQRLMQMLFQKC